MGPELYPDLPEQELQQRYRLGDRLALNELMRRHDSWLRERACRKSGGNKFAYEPDEPVNELWIKLDRQEKRDKYDPNRPWRPWAGRVLDNIILDLLKGENRHQRGRAQPPPELPDEPAPACVERIPNGEVGPEEEAARREMRKAMRDCLRRLPHDQRLVLILRNGLRKKLREVAEIMFEVDTATIGQVHQLEGQALAGMKDCMIHKGHDIRRLNYD